METGTDLQGRDLRSGDEDIPQKSAGSMLSPNDLKGYTNHSAGVADVPAIPTVDVGGPGVPRLAASRWETGSVGVGNAYSNRVTQVQGAQDLRRSITLQNVGQAPIALGSKMNLQFDQAWILSPGESKTIAYRGDIYATLDYSTTPTPVAGRLQWDATYDDGR